MEKKPNTFENFIVSACNRKAYRHIRAVLKGKKAGLILLHGPSFCGKTHLLSAVKYAYETRYVGSAVKLCSVNELLDAYIEACHAEPVTMFDLIGQYDLLLIDNMQFAAGRDATQEMLADCFRKMLDGGKSVILALDSSLDCMDSLLARMQPDSIAVAVKAPDKKLRKAYLKRLLQEKSVKLPGLVRKRVVSSGELSLSAMNGFLLKLQMLAKQKGRELTQKEMLTCLQDYGCTDGRIR